MDDNEVNKIIAEFIGYDIFNHEGVEYTESLDALVPVLEKLDSYVKIETRTTAEFNPYWDIVIDRKSHLGLEQTIQQAAAHATAKAILELKND